MAIKQITNPNSPNEQSINRGKQRSLRSTRVGNDARSVTPGADFTKGFSISLKDIDTAVLTYIRSTMKPTVREANETVRVTTLYGNEERWKAVRKNGVLRDQNNTIVLPIIVIKRSDISFNDDLPMSFKHDTKGEFISVARSSTWSKRNRYDRFSVQQQKKPVTEFITTGMPDFITCTYEVIMQTSYIEQMNVLCELFLEHSGTYFGDVTSYRFLATIDGSISDASEMSADRERIIRNEFSISLNGYVLPEFTSKIHGTMAQMKKVLTPSRVVFGESVRDKIK